MNNDLPVISNSPVGSCCAGLWLLLAGLLGASGVGLGAFEAHGLEAMLTKQEVPAEEIAKRLHNCEVAVRYQLFHAVAFVGLAALAKVQGGRCLQVAGFSWLLGTILFSGMLYVLVFTGSRSVVHLVPIGGVLQIVGWVALAVGASFSMGCCRTKS